MRKTTRSQHAGMAELADARDLKSREIFSRTGSTPASGTNYIAEWSSLVARRAHNPKVMRFKSHLRNQKNSNRIRRFEFFPFGRGRGSVRHDLRGYESEVAERPKGRITCNLGKND